MKAAVILLSGGMDSSTLLHYVKQKLKLKVRAIHALSFRYGQKHSRELQMARWQARRAGVGEHRVVDISFFGDLIAGGSALTDKSICVPDLNDLSGKQRRQPPTYVPNRNMLFLSLAAAYAEARGICDVFYGAQAQDEYGYWDCTVDFVKRMNHILRLNRGRAITVHAPFARRKKSDVLRIGLALGVDYGHTWTCYRAGRKPCGRCPTCVERRKAFDEVGVEDGLR
jgi:7-cyano-7-deazaguanine synthase